MTNKQELTLVYVPTALLSDVVDVLTEGYKSVQKDLQATKDRLETTLFDNSKLGNRNAYLEKENQQLHALIEQARAQKEGNDGF